MFPFHFCLHPLLTIEGCEYRTRITDCNKLMMQPLHTIQILSGSCIDLFPCSAILRCFNQPMVSNGIVTTEKTLSSQASMVRAFVQATIKGLNYVLANPADAVQISKSFIPNMNLTQATDELNATLPIWKGNGQHALGYNDLATWQAMAQFMASEKLIPASSDVSKAFTNV